MGPSESTSDATPRRGWLRFSLKSLFVVATLLCIWLADLSVRSRKQERAVARIAALSGSIAFDYELGSDRYGVTPDKRISPPWIRRLIGEDYFRNVVVISLGGASDPTDDDLKALEGLPSLRILWLTGLKRVTDNGLIHLASLRGLKELSLDGINMEGSGLRHIRSLHKLEHLSIDKVSLIDEDLEQLQDMHSLATLSLDSTRISDRGLQYLSNIDSLLNLSLDDTNITDAGLKDLEKLTGLQELHIRSTRTTPEGRAALQKSLPNCKVVF